MAGRSSGRIARRRVAKLPWRRVRAHSSRLFVDLGQVREAGMFRNTKQIARMRPVQPARSAARYIGSDNMADAMPGTAKLYMVVNPNVFVPRQCLRLSG